MGHSTKRKLCLFVDPRSVRLLPHVQLHHLSPVMPLYLAQAQELDLQRSARVLRAQSMSESLRRG